MFLVGQDRLPDEERAEGRDDPGGRGDSGEDRGLRGQHKVALWSGSEGGPDGAGLEFAGDDDDAEDADGELGEEESAEAVGGRVETPPGRRRWSDVVAGVRRASQQATEARSCPRRSPAGSSRWNARCAAWSTPSGQRRRPGGREPSRAGRAGGRGGRAAGGSHGRAVSPARRRGVGNRRCPRVMVMNASSSDGCRATSSCRTSRAGRPVRRRSASRPVTARAPSPAASTVPPARRSNAASRCGLGCADRDDVSGERAATNSATLVSAMQPAPADDDEVVGGQRHLAHQVAGDEHGAALGGQRP